MRNTIEKDFSTKKLVIFIVIILISIICLYLIAYNQFLASNNQYKKSITTSDFEKITDQVKGIKRGTVIEKNFKAKDDNLEKIIISFLKNEKVVTTSINIDVRLEEADSGKIIKEDNVNYNMIRYNNDYNFIFDTQKNSKGKNYKLIITFHKLGESDLNIEYTNKTLQKNSKVIIDGTEIKGTLGINEYYVSNSKIMKFNFVAFLMGIFVLALSIFIYTRKGLVPEKLFLYTVPIICFLFLIIMPMYRGHDETRHLLRAYELSEGHLLTEINDGKVGTSMPNNVIDGIKKGWREKLTYRDFIKIKDKKIDENDVSIPNMENVAVYSPIQYIPQALGMKIAKLFTDNLLIVLYAARILNLATCILLLYFAIKKMPFGKMLIYIISVLPLSIEAFATMSPDGITISTIMLFIAYILDITFTKDRKVEKKDIVILTILSAIIALCKIVYVPLVLLVLLIPADKYGSKRQKVITSIAITTISLIINLIWLKISSNYLAITSDGASTNKVKNILMAPVTYLKTLLYTINYNGSEYIETLFGSVLAMGEFVKLYFIVPFTYSILFLFESTTEPELKNKYSKFQNIIMLFIIVVITGLIFTSLYVQYTNTNSMTIQGVQGRYFIPILLLIGLLLSNLKIINNYEQEKKIKLIGIITVILQIYIMLAIIIVHI